MSFNYYLVGNDNLTGTPANPCNACATISF